MNRSFKIIGIVCFLMATNPILQASPLFLETDIYTPPGTCTNPVVNSFTASKMTTCSGETITLTVAGNLHDATNWHLYSNSCGGGFVGANSTGVFNVSPTSNTTYYIRGEGFCVIPGLCNTLDITVNPSFSISRADTVCSGESYTFPSGVTQNNITQQIIDTSFFQSNQNCDSNIITTIQVREVDTSVSINQQTLTSNATNVNYQWIDCDDGNIAISGATSQSYTATENGNYAVVVSTTDGCTDTSSCISILSVGVSTKGFFDEISIFPNPTKTAITVIGLAHLDEVSIRVLNLSGQVSYEKNNITSPKHLIELNTKAGVYVLEIIAQNKRYYHKIIKQ